MEKQPTKAQTAVLNHMFTGRSETDSLILEHISRGVFMRWQKDPVWIAAFREEVEHCRREAQLTISNFTVFAAAKLVGLAGCDKEAVARQACIDILDMKLLIVEKESLPEKLRKTVKLDEKTIETVLRILADHAPPEDARQ